MNVSELLRRKGSEVTVVDPDATIAAAAALLVSQRIGALVVTDDAGGIAGIISERDIVRSIVELGGAGLDARVSEVMTAPVQTCDRGDLVEGLMSVMTERRIRHLPVERDGRLEGIISIGDVVKHRVEELEDERRHLTDYIQTGR